MSRPDAPRTALRVKPSGLLLAAVFLLLSRSWLLPASLFTAAACHELAHCLALRALHAPPRTLTLSASGASLYVPGLTRSSQELFKMLPYLVTIAVLIFISLRKKRENQPPASLGLAYFREER